MTINCIIIDDEPLARKGLMEYIADVEFLQLAGEFDNPVKAMDLLTKEEVQLLFLDIQMPKISGLDFFKTLKYAPPVIFTTAFPQHALEGFELNALDYLVKPVSFERFLKAINKLDIPALDVVKPVINETENDAFIYVKSEKKNILINNKK